MRLEAAKIKLHTMVRNLDLDEKQIQVLFASDGKAVKQVLNPADIPKLVVHEKGLVAVVDLRKLHQ